MTTSREERLRRQRRFVQSQAALETMKRRDEQQRNPFDAVQQTAVPTEKQEEPGFFSKAINALTWLGDVGFGLVTSNIPTDALGLESSYESQVKKGGSGTTKPVYLRQRERRAELLNQRPDDPWGSFKENVNPFNWKDYAQATRKAYIEAREDKEYKRGIPLAGEILSDPTTYMGGYAVKGLIQGARGTLKYGGKLVDPKFLKEVVKEDKILPPSDIFTQFKRSLFKESPVGATKGQSQVSQEIAKQNDWSISKFISKVTGDETSNNFRGILGGASDRLFGPMIRYGKQSKVAQPLLRLYYRMSDDGRSAFLAKQQFDTSAKSFGIEDVSQHLDGFFDEKGFANRVIDRKTGKIIKDADFQDINRAGQYTPIWGINKNTGKRIIVGAKDQRKNILSPYEFKKYKAKIPTTFQINGIVDGSLNQADYIAGFFTLSVREILEKIGAKNIDQLTELQIKNIRSNYVRYADESLGSNANGMIRAMLQAHGTLDELRFLLKKQGLNLSALLIHPTQRGLKGNDYKIALKQFEELEEFVSSPLADRIYFPHAMHLLKAHESSLKNLFEIKSAGGGRFTKYEPVLKNRTMTSEELSNSIIEGKMKFHKVGDTLSLITQQIKRVIREDQLFKEVARDKLIKDIVVLPRQELEVLRKTLKNMADPKRKKRIISAKQMATIQKDAPYLAGLVRAGQNAEEISEAIGRRIVTDADKPLKGLSDLTTLINEKKIPNDKLFNVFFRNEKTAKKYIEGLDLTANSKWRTATRGLESANDLMRTLGTGFDFSWHMLQGLTTLGSAFRNPRMWGVYGTSMKNAALAFIDERNVKLVFEGMDPRVIKDSIENGRIGPSRQLTDIYAGTDILTETSERLVQKLGVDESKGLFHKSLNFILKAPSRIAQRAQRAFSVGGDTVRIKGYETLLPLARSSAKEIAEKTGLNATEEAQLLLDLKRQIGAFMTKATGGMDMYALGLPAAQQSVERAVLWFSPSYQRASYSLIASVMKGNLEGRLARESLYGMAMLGTTIYVAQATMLGQEPNLDPSSSDYMTLRIGDSDVGIGGFHRGLLSFLTRFADRTFTEENLFEKDQTHPFVSYMRGKSSPSTSTLWDLWEGKNYVGEPIEQSAMGYGKTIGNRLLPFWMENVFTSDPLTGDYEWTNPNVTGLAAELFGLRSIPISVYDERKRIRDEVAQEYYGKGWNDINSIQRNVITRESDYLQNLNKEASRLSAFRGGEVQKQLNVYYQESDRILDSYNKRLAEGIDMVEKGIIDIAGLRSVYLSQAGQDYYIRRKALRDRTEGESDLNLVGTYWTQVAGMKEENMDYQDDVLDVAYQDYINSVILNPDIETLTGETDWYARDIAINKFENRWGNKGLPDIMNYVKARGYVARDLPPIVTEFNAAKDYFSYYWRETEKAVLENVNETDALMYKEYKLESNKLEQEKMKNMYSSIGRIISDINGARKSLRQMDQAVDGFLYRWGYTTTLAHPKNKNKNDVWRYPSPFTLEQYQGSV